jgi:esterase
MATGRAVLRLKSFWEPAASHRHYPSMRFELQRRQFLPGSLKLSFLDAGGDGRPLLALHGHWMDARTFESLAASLAPAWRTIALDQRGHGYSDHAPDYDRASYLQDISHLLDYLSIRRCFVLGHSLGGVNAYYFAAQNPGRVAALVIEDIGTVLQVDMAFVKPWAGIFATRHELEKAIGERLAPYLRSSIRETASGWTLAFDPADMIRSSDTMNGDHWPAWLASSCPALVVAGKKSQVSATNHLREMAARRPHTKFVELDAGHVVHADAPREFETHVRDFLNAEP